MLLLESDRVAREDAERLAREEAERIAREEVAARLAREENLAPNTRLACQIAAIQSDLTINVINRLATSGLEDPGPRPIEW